MLYVYNAFINIYFLLIFLSSLFNKKAKLWLKGRKNLIYAISKTVDSSKKHIWFHFASLGEFEQGRTVIERIKTEHPEKSIIITFFSPSGYEVRKNYPIADHVFYLPSDTAHHAREVIRLFNPEVAIFTKYEFWYHYYKELNRKNISLYVISAIFMKDQSFFKWYGAFNRSILHFVSHFFVQDENSKLLLETLNVNADRITVSGDTRFDRVSENAAHPKPLPEINLFCDNYPVFIAGSTWPDDEELLAKLALKYKRWKFIFVPHEIKELKLQALEQMLHDNFIRLSDLTNLNEQHRFLIIDNIGMLSSIYRYGAVAYIGGGFGKGIHNTLEAAAFGLPVIFGPNYHKFREAKELIKEGAGFTIENDKELDEIMLKLQNKVFRDQAAAKAAEFVKTNTGATDTILEKIKIN